MPYIHNIDIRVGHRRTSTRFWVSRADKRFSIPRVHQLDEHSCGFLAALNVIQHYDPSVTVEQALRTVVPSPQWGCTQPQLRAALRFYGIDPQYKKGLDWYDLLQSATEGTPVIICIYPWDYSCSHWTVVRGVTNQPRTVWLSNAYESDAGIGKLGQVTWSNFRQIWYSHGEGIVCRELKAAKG